MRSSSGGNRGGGRRHKGPRHPTMVRLPEDRHQQLKEIAEREGMDLGDYLVRVVLEAHDWPAPAYCYPAPTQQGELPIARAS